MDEPQAAPESNKSGKTRRRRRKREPYSIKGYENARRRFGRLLRWLFRITAEGGENIPAEGRVILCCNHRSFLDPIVLGVTFPRSVNFLARSTLFDKPILRGLLRWLGCIPINREKPEVETFRAVRATLESERALGIFPEGTRTRTGQLGPVKPGVGMLVVRDDAPVIPAALVYPKKPGLFRPSHVLYGKPIDPAELTELGAGRDYRAIAERIMGDITGLYETLRARYGAK